MRAMHNDTKLNTPSSPFIVDTTFRDGEQCPGVIFSIKEKIKLFEMMIRAGVKEFEIGIPAMGVSAAKEIRQLQQIAQARSVRTLCWTRCTKSDIESCVEVGSRAIHLSLPVSDRQMRILGFNRTELLNRLKDSLEFALKNFSFVSLGAQDAFRADVEYVARYIDTAYSMGINRIRLSDTVGTANPLETHQKIKRLKEAFDGLQVEFHGHNDFGMATANAIAAIQAGADGISTTLLGLGERAGNAALESVVLASREILNTDFGIDTKALYPLCRCAAQISGITLSPYHPIVGDNVLVHESGIHTHGQLHDPKAFQPILAEEIGRKQPGFRYGTHTGRFAVRRLLETVTHVPPTDALTDRVTSHIRQLARQNKTTFNEEEVVGFARRLNMDIVR